MLNIQITLQVMCVPILGSFIVPHLISASVVTTFMELFNAMTQLMTLAFLAATV